MWSDDFYRLNDISELLKELRKEYRIFIEPASNNTFLFYTKRGLMHVFTMDKDYTEYSPTSVCRAMIKFIHNIGGEEMKKEPQLLHTVYVDTPVMLKAPKYKKYVDSTGSEYHGGNKDGTNN